MLGEGSGIGWLGSSTCCSTGHRARVRNGEIRKEKGSHTVGEKATAEAKNGQNLLGFRAALMGLGMVRMEGNKLIFYGKSFLLRV